jgi:hypothetical protein
MCDVCCSTFLWTLRPIGASGGGDVEDEVISERRAGGALVAIR